MDPSDLLPGLATMLEKRVPAPWGYRLGTVVTVAAAFAVMLLPLFVVALIVGALAGIAAVIEWVPLPLGGHVWEHVIVFGVMVVMHILWLLWVWRRIARSRGAFADEVREFLAYRDAEAQRLEGLRQTAANELTRAVEARSAADQVLEDAQQLANEIDVRLRGPMPGDGCHE